MSERRFCGLFHLVCMFGAAALLAACSTAETAINQQPAVTASSPADAAPAAPMTREKASTDCWMKYEKEGRHLSLDQRLPLVEKCTAEKLKAAAR
jgi:hypothetical protein